MKIVKFIVTILLISNVALAQDNDNGTHKRKALTISNKGIKIEESDGKEGFFVSNTDKNDEKSSAAEDKFELHWGSMDLGINSLQDKTNYSSAAAQNFLKVDASVKNSNLFDMNQGKSINVNIYPLLTKYRLVKTNNFKLYLVSGVGLQFYNFRFNKPITYVNTSTPAVIMDTVNFSKNKLAFDYLNVPLGLTFKNRLSKSKWLVYGFGLTGGYRLASWTKQVSDERGKQKVHDKFDFADFNSCVTAEIGIDDVFRLYASYQLTSLQTDGLNQHPFSIGIRFSGI